MEAKIVGFSVFVCLCSLFGNIYCDSIPMWEKFDKLEKMQRLYDMFSYQVEDFCENNELNNCKKELMDYGLNKLRAMPEDHLDTMDPYQKDAHHIIWGAMMDGHEMMKTTPSPRRSTTPQPNSYDDESFGDDGFGYQSAASAKIDNVYRVPPPKDFVYQAQSGTPQYTYPHNVVTYLNTYNSINKNKAVYNTEYQQKPTTTESYEDDYNRILTGPMVVKVYRDGTPVRDYNQEIPQDEDLRHYQLTKVKIPAY